MQRKSRYIFLIGKTFEPFFAEIFKKSLQKSMVGHLLAGQNEMGMQEEKRMAAIAAIPDNIYLNILIRGWG